MDSISIQRRSVASDLVEISGHLQSLKEGVAPKVAASKNDLLSLWNVATKDPAVVPSKQVAHLETIADNPLHPYSSTATELLGGSQSEHNALLDVYANEEKASASSIAKVTSMATKDSHPLSTQSKSLVDTVTSKTDQAAVDTVAAAKASGTKAPKTAVYTAQQIAAKANHRLNAAATDALTKAPSTSWWSRLTSGN